MKIECKSCQGNGIKEDKTYPKKYSEGYNSIPCPKCNELGYIIICEYCGKVIKHPEHAGIKYHKTPQNGREKSCAEYARLENNNTSKQKHRKTLVGSNKKELGSKGTGMKAPLSSNHEEAHKQLQKERERLNLPEYVPKCGMVLWAMK